MLLQLRHKLPTNAGLSRREYPPTTPIGSRDRPLRICLGETMRVFEKRGRDDILQLAEPEKPSLLVVLPRCCIKAVDSAFR